MFETEQMQCCRWHWHEMLALHTLSPCNWILFEKMKTNQLSSRCGGEATFFRFLFVSRLVSTIYILQPTVWPLQWLVQLSL